MPFSALQQPPLLEQRMVRSLPWLLNWLPTGMTGKGHHQSPGKEIGWSGDTPSHSFWAQAAIEDAAPW